MMLKYLIMKNLICSVNALNKFLVNFFNLSFMSLFNRKINILIGIIFIVILIPSFAFSQFGDKRPPAMMGERNIVFIDPIVFYEKDSSKGRLDLYIEIPQKNLQFKYNPVSKKYESSFEYFVSISNSNINGLDYSYSETISGTEEEMKKNTKSVFRVKQYFLSPGIYKLKFVLKDYNSNNEYPENFEFAIKNNEGKNLVFSDIMLLSEYKINTDGKKEITPLISGIIRGLKELFFFFEINNNTDTVINNNYTYVIYDMEEEECGRGIFNCVLNPGLSRIFEKINLKNNISGNFKINIFDKNSNAMVAQKIIKGLPEDTPFMRGGPKRN
jgi:hypothetical protein